MTITNNLFHEARLPFCYLDKYRQKVVIRAFAKDALSVDILYGDPYDYVKASGLWRWNWAKAPLEKQFSLPDGSAVWRVCLPVPPLRRMKYAFCVQTACGDFYYSENGVEPYTDACAQAHYRHFSFPYMHEVDAPSVPQWAVKTVWYQIFPERFYNGDDSLSPKNISDWRKGKTEAGSFFGGDLEGVRQKLNYLADLGVNGIYFTPVFSSPSNHKYDTRDYYKIDEHFGSIDTMKKLVEEAHKAGIRVMLDAVYNHAGESHPFWQDVIKNGEKSAYRDYFCIKKFPVNPHQKAPDVTFETFAQVNRMPKWNTETLQAREYLLRAAEYWIRECDIDGWRLDVANEVSFDFWREFSRRVRALKNDFYIVGEVWYDAGAWINGGFFDAVMNYAPGFAISDFFLKKTIDADEFSRRLFPVISRYSDLHNACAFNLLDSHDTDRALTRACGDKQALRNAFTFLMLLPGSPCIYYGTEVGMEGANDPDNRRPMLWDERRDMSMYNFFKKLIRFRLEYADLFAQGSLLYNKDNGAPRWTVRPVDGRGKALTAVYLESGNLPSGRIVFSASESGAAERGALAIIEG